MGARTRSENNFEVPRTGEKGGFMWCIINIRILTTSYGKDLEFKQEMMAVQKLF